MDKEYVWQPLKKGFYIQPTRPTDHNWIELRDRRTDLSQIIRPSEIPNEIDAEYFEWRQTGAPEDAT